jgi:hypothetical protein
VLHTLPSVDGKARAEPIIRDKLVRTSGSIAVLKHGVRVAVPHRMNEAYMSVGETSMPVCKKDSAYDESRKGFSELRYLKNTVALPLVHNTCYDLFGRSTNQA